MVNPEVSIIIVNYCGKKQLQSCLKSITSETKQGNYEIIIADNNSSDDSVHFLEKNYPDIKLIKLDKNYGFAIPNNLAAKIAGGKFLVFLNNDTTITQNWLSELVKAMENDKMIVMAQSLLLHPDGSVDSSGDFIDSWGRAYSNHDIPKKIRYILSPRAASMIIKKDIFLELGGFDEDYFASFEDIELGWKSWLWGYRVVVVPSSIVYHSGGETVRQLSKTIAFHGVKNNLMLRFTNFNFFDSTKSIFLIMILVFFKKFFGRSIIKDTDKRFNIPDLGTIVKASFWFLRNFIIINKKRKLLKSRQVRTNKELKTMGLIT